MIRLYYQLTKPGIIYGNSITAIAGFLFASRWHIHWQLFLAMLVGLSFIIGSACVFNNIYDAEIDASMERTKDRPIVTGKVSKTAAKVFGFTLLILGTLFLSLFTTYYALMTALAGWLVYVLLYTPLKKLTVHDTLIGSIAGAVPPVVGYTAVTNKIDIAAVVLFLMLIFWQMPHFYAIAIYRMKDYAKANIPVLPIKMGLKTAKINILIYCIGFLAACLLLTASKAAGYSYGVIAFILGSIWITISVRGFYASNSAAWARKMFLSSLMILTTLSAAVSVAKILP